VSTLQVIRVVAPWIKQYYNIDGANYIIPNIGEHSAAVTLPTSSSYFCHCTCSRSCSHPGVSRKGQAHCMDVGVTTNCGTQWCRANCCSLVT
jgi:hypothetical protein